MANDYFEFKQFTIQQDKCAMKVGTDSVLLGAWVRAKSKIRILDIGTGTGILALMLAQKSSGVIDAVELDKMAASQAEENFKASPWSERLNSFQGSIQEFARSGNNNYDLIVINPPYFITGKRAKDSHRAQARHSDSLQLSELVAIARAMMHQTGRFAIILPFDMRKELIEEISANGMWVKREALIRPLEHEEFVRIMFEFSFKMCDEIEKEEIIIEEGIRHSYHASFKKYTKDYYLDSSLNG